MKIVFGSIIPDAPDDFALKSSGTSPPPPPPPPLPPVAPALSNSFVIGLLDAFGL